MSLEPILGSTECWCRSNVGRQTVPHRRTSDGECPVAKTVWCEGRQGLHELQSGEQREWKLMRLVHISPVCNLVPYHSAPCRLINIVWTWCALSPAASVVCHVRMELHALDGHHLKSLELQSSVRVEVCQQGDCCSQQEGCCNNPTSRQLDC